MITPTQVKKAYNSLLQGLFKEISRYGIEVTEGYSVPSFFVRVNVLDLFKRETISIAKSSMQVETTYFQETKNEVDCLKKAESIREALGDYLNVDGKMILISDYEISWTGKSNDIMQITFELEFYDNIKQPIEQLMKEFKFKEELEHGNA